MKIYINGNIIDESEAKVSVFDRSYLFGEGLFETFRSYDGKLPFLDKHLARLEWSATFVGLPFPHPKEIREGIVSLLTENKLTNARIKIILSAINEGIKPQPVTSQTPVNLVILMEKFQPLANSEYEKGVTLKTIRSTRNEPPPVSNIKTTSYACKMIARREFMERDVYDGILLSAGGFVTETTSANIFWVKDDSVFTPPLAAGLLGGITRQVIGEILKTQKIELKEQTITPEELKNRTEVFITGSTLEVMPVTVIDEKRIGDGKPGLMTQRIRDFYRQRIKHEMGLQAP